MGLHCPTQGAVGLLTVPSYCKSPFHSAVISQYSNATLPLLGEGAKNLSGEGQFMEAEGSFSKGLSRTLGLEQQKQCWRGQLSLIGTRTVLLCVTHATNTLVLGQ